MTAKHTTRCEVSGQFAPSRYRQSNTRMPCRLHDSIGVKEPCQRAIIPKLKYTCRFLGSDAGCRPPSLLDAEDDSPTVCSALFCHPKENAFLIRAVLDHPAKLWITAAFAAGEGMEHCDVVSDSNNSDALDLSGSARMTTPCAITVGGV